MATFAGRRTPEESPIVRESRARVMTRVRTALIIGGGIAGPVSAMALQKAGIESTVFEARPAGAGVLSAGEGLGQQQHRAAEA